MSRWTILFVTCCCLVAAACSSGSSSPTPTPVGTPATDVNFKNIPVVGGETVTTASGLKYVDITPGDGAAVAQGQKVTVSYSMWLVPDGTLITGEKPVSTTFTVGQDQALKGLDEGVSTMRVGGKRRLLIPPDLGYGSQGLRDSTNLIVVVPPGSTVVVDVSVTKAE